MTLIGSGTLMSLPHVAKGCNTDNITCTNANYCGAFDNPRGRGWGQSGPHLGVLHFLSFAEGRKETIGCFGSLATPTSAIDSAVTTDKEGKGVS